MKFVPRESATIAEMDMSPMIDMVFLLLIFFLVASHFVDAKPLIAIPEARAATMPTDITNRLMISVKEDGTYLLGNEGLPASLELISEHIAAARVDNDELSVLIRADAKVPYEANERIMKVCADHGANSLIYAAFEE